MKLLIVGCAGQVGRELVRRAPADWEVKAVDRQELDITDHRKVMSVVSEFRPNSIINAAAYTAVDRAESEREFAYLINSTGAENLAIAAQQVDASFLHISTDYVFSGDHEGCYVETDTTGPTGVYGASKLAGEQAVAMACKKHIILRTAWVFGEYGNNFVKTMLRLAKDREQLSIVGDQFGSPTYAGDIAETLLAIAGQLKPEDERWGVYHYSGYPYTSWAGFAAEIFTSATKHSVLAKSPSILDIKTVEYPTPAKRPSNSKLDCGKLLKSFNIAPSDWQKALENIGAYHG